MMQHSRFGGSTASRWLNCPGSVGLSATMPNVSSVYAEEGSFAHALAEQCLKGGDRVADGYIGTQVSLAAGDSGSNKIVDAPMAQAVQVYLDAVWEAFDEDPRAELYVEERFELPVPTAEPGEVYGSNDACIFASGKLTVVDYKHGMGVPVSAYENRQLMFYATGAVACHPDWDVQSIELVIVQPRAVGSDDNGGVKRWEMPLWQLLDYPAEIAAAIAEAKSDAPGFHAGEHCRWCPASTICTVREQNFLAAAKLDFASVAEITASTRLPVVDALELTRMAAILESADHLAAWVSSIRDRVEGLLLAGQPVPGWKVVEKQSRRRWVDNEEEIAAYLVMFYGLSDDDVRPRKLVTITETEKKLKSALDKSVFAAAKAELAAKYMLKESSGLTIAHEGDKRPAVVPAEAEFGSVNLSGLFDGASDD